MHNFIWHFPFTIPLQHQSHLFTTIRITKIANILIFVLMPLFYIIIILYFYVYFYYICAYVYFKQVLSTVVKTEFSVDHLWCCVDHIENHCFK